MTFLVKLIDVDLVKSGEGRKDLQANCTHVANDYWLFEGEDFALHDDIDFRVVGESAIESYGQLNADQLRRMVSDAYNVDPVYFT